MEIIKVKTVEEFIHHHDDHKKELEFLRQLIQETELDEHIKWFFPVYCLNNKNVLGLGSFKKYVGIWFYQGVFLSDPLGVLVNAQEGVTKAMRQWRFSSIEEIVKYKSAIIQYCEEAIQNQKDGKEIKIDRRKKELIIPDLLMTELKKNKNFKSQFEALSNYKQREYCNYIIEAKREQTKLKRLEKIIPMIMLGVGLNDKYK